MDNKKAVFGSLVSIILVLIGGLLIIAIVAYIFKGFTDPNRVEDGVMCRITIQTSNRLKETTQGLSPDLITDACKTIEKRIPMQETYPEFGGKVSRLTTKQFRDVVMFDIAKLVNNAWWITGEGDTASDYFMKKMRDLLVSTNGCYLVYAIRIDAPSQIKADEFNNEFKGITEGDLTDNLKQITRSQVKPGAKGDMRDILTYITLDGNGAGLYFKKDTKIILEANGADALYGIAVGFKDPSGIAKIFATLTGQGKEAMKADANFIYLAPYDQIAKECKVIV